MSRRRNRSSFWGPTALPKIAAKQTAADRDMVARHRDNLGDPSLPEDLRESMERNNAWFAASLHGWELSDFFWVTEAMSRVALDASTDMPGFIPEAEAPAPAGLMAFETSLPEVVPPNPMLAKDGTLVAAAKVDAIRWYRANGKFVIVPLCRIENFGDHPLNPDAPLQELFEVRVSSASLTWDSFPGVEDGDAGATARAAVVVLLGAAWHLMQQPTVATPQPRETTTGAPRGPRKPDEAPSQVVTTVDLRTMRFVPTEKEPAETSRTYRHRWVVRGHWRNQTHGKNHEQRRLQWVPSFVKGPEGAPLLASEKVMVWRR